MSIGNAEAAFLKTRKIPNLKHQAPAVLKAQPQLFSRRSRNCSQGAAANKFQ